MSKKQTAGRDNLGKLAPKFAELNDDVLFGEVWSREKELSARDRSMITIAALFSAGLYPQLKAHLALGKEHGVTKQEAVEICEALGLNIYELESADFKVEINNYPYPDGQSRIGEIIPGKDKLIINGEDVSFINRPGTD